MRMIRQTGRYVAIGLCLAVLAGCPSLGPGRLPPSIDRAESLVRRGDHLGAAREFEALANQNPGTAGLPYQYRAANEYLLAQRTDDAQRLVDGISAMATAGPAPLELTLLRAELALARAQPQAAWSAVANVATPADPLLASRLLELRQRAALATSRPIDAIRAEIAREPLLTGDAARADSRRELLAGLRAAADRGVKLEPHNAREMLQRGWLELGLLAVQAEHGNISTALAAWRARYPTHPGMDLARTGLQFTQEPNGPVAPGAPRSATAQVQPPLSMPGAHIALLLPVTGRTAAAAAQIRDGLLTGLYAIPAASRPALRVYDTGSMTVAEAIDRAVDQGAQQIIGPLTRDEVLAAAEYSGHRPPILALNFLPAEKPVPADFYQYALSPEDEARQVARRALADGRRRAIAILPAGDWGARVGNAFRDELTAGGGQLLVSATYPPGANDFSEPIQQSLRLSESAARKRRIESIVGASLQFAPRRRTDVDFLFTPAPANTERQLRPQLRFHFAGDIPAYTTSDSFEPSSQANQDLDGLIFPDMPWVLGGNSAVTRVRASAQAAWGDDAPHGKLYAFGYDAWQLSLAISAGSAANPATRLVGLTGELSFDEQHRIKRELNWAQFHGAAPRLLTRGSAP